jgi:periplasmic protein TonB
MTEMTATSIQKPSFIALNRNVVIAGSVLLFHALAIWVLQAGLLMRAVEIIVPVEILAQIIDLPAPKITPPVPQTTPPVPVKQTITKPVPVTQAPPQILTLNEPATVAPTFVAPPPLPPAPLAAPAVPVAAVASPPSPPPASLPTVPAKIVLPSSDADYLSNPKPSYPPMSKRLNEQGEVKVRVYIGADGLPKKSELQKTSGFERLDQAALAAVMQWRYVPGKRDGVAEAMWMGTTITYILE